MTLLRRLVSVVRWIVNRRKAEQSLDDELQAFIDASAAEKVRDGLPFPEARRLAMLNLGGLEQAKERVRTYRHGAWLDEVGRDIRYAVRMFGRNPGFTAVVVLTLALGIGANTAMFTIMNGVLLRPLNYSKPEQLMYLTAEFPALASTGHALSVQEYVEFREFNQSFVAVGAYKSFGGTYTTSEVNLATGDRPQRVRSISVDAHLLRTLGVRPVEGRFFSDEETDRPGGLAPPLAVLSYELWQTAFGGRPVVGQSVLVEGRPHEVLGIMPEGIDVMDNRTAIWLPLGLPAVIRQDRGLHVLHVVGRLKDGVTAQAAQTELDVFLENWGERTRSSGHVPTSRPSMAEDHSLRLRPLQDAIVGDAARSIWILQVAVLFVLLIVCVNLASLLMARADSRRLEFAVRVAFGASRSRLFRQTLTEGVVLCIAGGLTGLGLAHIAVQSFVRVYPASMPRMGDIAIDLPVLLFAVTVSLATGVVFGLAPVASRRVHDLMAAFKEGGGRGASRAGRSQIRRALVAIEVALAVVLVVGSGLLTRTVYNLTNVDAGFDRPRLVTFSMTLAEPYEPDARVTAYQRLLEKLRATPDVQGAAIMAGLPPYRSPEAVPTRIDNHTAADGSSVEVVDYYQATMGEYFETVGLTIVAGRGFDRTDIASSDPVVVVNETLAKKIWREQSPIGQRLRPNLGAAFGIGSTQWHTVIGVVKDVKQGGVQNQTGTELYVSLDQIAMAPPTMNVVLRTAMPAMALSRTLDRLVGEIDPTVPVVRLRDMDSVFADSIRRPRLLAQLLGAFAGLALLLAAVGTYGVLSYTVMERRREIGIRLALGAARSSVLALVMTEGLRLTTVGIAVGLVCAFGLTRLMGSVLFGVQPTDPTTLVAVALTITLVAVVACWLPAWRASRLDPNAILRAD